MEPEFLQSIYQRCCKSQETQTVLYTEHLDLLVDENQTQHYFSSSLPSTPFNYRIHLEQNFIFPCCFRFGCLFVYLQTYGFRFILVEVIYKRSMRVYILLFVFFEVNLLYISLHHGKNEFWRFLKFSCFGVIDIFRQYTSAQEKWITFGMYTRFIRLLYWKCITISRKSSIRSNYELQFIFSCK